MNARTPSLRQTLLSAAAVALTACGGGDGASLRFSAIGVKAGFTQDSTSSTLELNLKFSEDARFESANLRKAD